MSFGYNGGLPDYCCMDTGHGGPGFIYHHPGHHHHHQPPLPPATSHQSNLNNVPSDLSVGSGQQLTDVLPKTNVFSAPHRGLAPDLSHFMHGKDMSSRLASLGHERAVQHVQSAGTSGLPQDKLSPNQISSLVSDIFRSDLQYHSAESHQHQHQQQAQPQPQNTHQQLQHHSTTDMLLPQPASSPSPPKKRKRSRKMKDPTQRKIKPAGTHLPRDEIKRRRIRGDEYITRSGKLIKKKEFVMVDCKCRRNCSLRVPEDVRQKIFEEFHSMADWNSQTQFIVASITVTDVKRKSKKPVIINAVDEGEKCDAGAVVSQEPVSVYVSRRSTSRIFYLTQHKIQVCKAVFMSTLGITGKRVDYALRHKAIPMTAIATPDRRGRKVPKNKTSAKVEERIRAHINSFPTNSNRSFSSSSSSVAAPSTTSPTSNSTSKSSPAKTSNKAKSLSNLRPTATQLHLPADLTITKMYQMYQDQCRADGINPASMWVYTKILHQESKFRTAPHRSHSSSSSSSSSIPLSTSQTIPCQCCERSYAILTSGDPPDKILHDLMREHHNRLQNSITSAQQQISSSYMSHQQKIASGKSKKLMNNVKPKPPPPLPPPPMFDHNTLPHTDPGLPM